jgi:protoporphyrinogen oxidase
VHRIDLHSYFSNIIGVTWYPVRVLPKLKHSQDLNEVCNNNLHSIMSRKRTAIIAGAGPAGLTAALELLRKTDIKPVVYEASNDTGGISKTVTYKGNRIDIGGHRFFSKSDVVMDWWHEILPTQSIASASDTISLAYKGKTTTSKPTKKLNPDQVDEVMLVRSRISRIYHGEKFYDYPLTLSTRTIKNLGFRNFSQIGISYAKATILPRRPEKNLEDFLINRFGRRLYLTFFKDYTEKVWGVECKDISAEWGAQRIKGVSIGEVVRHAFASSIGARLNTKSAHRKKSKETSLIEHFLYPKYGPGQLWELVAQRVIELGGEIHYGSRVTNWHADKKKISSVDVINGTGEATNHKADYFFSTVPIKELVGSLRGFSLPSAVKRVAKGLAYRDFITVGLLLKSKNKQTGMFEGKKLISDNWIYIQDGTVTVGRIQIFNNWSPYLVRNPDTVWVGLEYFANVGDAVWSLTDTQLKKLAQDELIKLGFAAPGDVVDGVVVRMKKAYPAYTGTYKDFDIVKKYVNKFENLFLVGRNGMHRYNNQDHSMLTAMQAVQDIVDGVTKKDNIWNINTEEDYHETK